MESRFQTKSEALFVSSERRHLLDTESWAAELFLELGWDTGLEARKETRNVDKYWPHSLIQNNYSVNIRWLDERKSRGKKKKGGERWIEKQVY